MSRLASNEIKIYAIKEKLDCPACAGFGGFDFSAGGTKLRACRKCCSIHPEMLGLRFDGLSEHYYYYELTTKFLLLKWKQGK